MAEEEGLVEVALPRTTDLLATPQPLDVFPVVTPPPAPRHLLRAHQPPADIGVEGLPSYPEELGGLVGIEVRPRVGVGHGGLLRRIETLMARAYGLREPD